MGGYRYGNRTPKRKIRIETRVGAKLDKADLDIPVFMKEDLLPIMGEEQMIQELPEAFHKVLEEQSKWQK